MLRIVLTALLAGLAVTLLANLCTTVYLHRALSHRALTLSRAVSASFRSVLWITTGIKRREWVAVHRKHHAFTDIEGDPHSPVLLGWVQVQVRNLALYRREAANPVTVARYAKDLPTDRADRWCFDRSLLGLGLGIAILVALFGPWAGPLAALVHVNLYLGGSAAVNAIAHHFGRKPYPNRAGNLQWLAFLTAGEGLHNNHHAAPTSAKLSHRWFEIDPGWWCIKTLTWFRLAKVRLKDIRVGAGATARAAVESATRSKAVAP